VTDLKGELSSLKIDRESRRRSPWRRSILLLVPAVLVLLLLYVLRWRQAASALEVRVVQASLSGAGATSGSGQILTASGYVVARRKAVVSAKIQGRLADLRVEEGSRVEQGEVIARLEGQDYQAQVERQRAQVQRSEADLAEYQRQLRLAEELTQDDVLAKDQYEAAQSRVRIAEASLRQAQAELALAQAQLENTLIRAPFAGVVVKKMAEVGESVAPIPPGVNISTSSGAIVALADLDTLEVEADVSESNVAKLRADQPAEVTVEAFPDRRYRAVVRQIIPTADRTRATVMVKVTILEKDKDLKPEMSARVTFLEMEGEGEPSTGEDRTQQVTVPVEALATREGETVVFLVRDGRAVQRVVVKGLERQGQVAIKQGLAGGETLVASPPEALRDGSVVKVSS
jgi:RND family efflux transporter MFP subunit